jgi:hypothetical protein
MADESIHELTAAYALDALDERESAAYEQHLAECDRCRDELASLSGAATALAYAVESPPPPAALRGRILAAARTEHDNVVPLRRRRPFQIVSAAAVVAACAAVVLGVWAASLHRSLQGERAARAAQARAAAIIADPRTRRVPVAGRAGTLFLAPTGRAALVLESLPNAPHAKTYEAWVIRGSTPQRAGTFDGGGRTVVPLDVAVPRGSVVAVTVERAGGVSAPTSAPFVHATA